MEKHQTEQIRCKTYAACNQHQYRLGYDLWADKPLNAIDQKSKTKSKQEYTVDEGSKDLSSLPAIRIFRFEFCPCRNL
ncbi:hypothetical protein INT44_005070 [Umbelopsis vinacea]|uniref:Uncharacterized protein n=1 Tax=Umbelopsis vinacea TaxID=44442 RepID=A0A8H7Q900_9FUNG|nr:hypothetical protein INT44_005070 [Umbelopsis vinacea]